MAIDLTEDMKSGDKADKAKAHHENHRRSNLQARSVIGVEPEHVASATATAEPAGATTSAPRSEAAATHASGSCSRAARRHADGGRTGGNGR